MSDDTLKLYTDAFNISPYVFSCFVTLREKGIPFQPVMVGLHLKEHQSPAFRDPSITAKVPAIEHRGFWLAESSAIVEYLDEVFPAPAYPRAMPADPRDRARARQVMAWIRSDLMDIREERSTHTMFYERAARPLSERGEAAALRLLRVANRLIPDGRRSLFGAWSCADADLAFMLQRLIINGHPVEGKARAFAEAQWSRPSARAFIDQKRPPYVKY